MTDPKRGIDRLLQEMDQARTDAANAGKGEMVKAPKHQSLDAAVTGAGMLFVLGLSFCLPTQADNTTFELIELPPLPSVESLGSAAMSSSSSAETTNRLWFSVSASTPLKRFAELLRLDTTVLTNLNKVPASHVFAAGSWIALPDSARVVAVTLSSLDRDSERQTPPVAVPPPRSNLARI